MAPGSRTRQCASSSSRRSSETDELAAIIERATTPTNTGSIAHSTAPASTLASSLAQAPKPFVYLRTVAKLHMAALTQAQTGRLEEPRERPLKARLPDLYYRTSHMECYHFYQQCEDHFDTAGATGPNRTPFAASFLRDRIGSR